MLRKLLNFFNEEEIRQKTLKVIDIENKILKVQNTILQKKDLNVPEDRYELFDTLSGIRKKIKEL
ncbi:MAG: hypothetical protein GY827_04490 [Cytophagales bacterium]|nr:hypothetical protein [Cytophagales bacterium]